MPAQRHNPTITQEMVWERSTNGYHVYVADFGMPIRNVYIERTTWPSGQHPNKVTITVTNPPINVG